MSLWTKSLDDVSFDDVKDFCLTTQKPREGLRLDFKQEVPKDLGKLIAAFANTNGGMIIVGIKSDAKNEPEWPPAGLSLKPGLSEQFNQIAQQAIYPPVPIVLSGFLENPHRPGTGVIVLRVHESPEAPHAVDGGRKIYERTGDITNPTDFAHIERIERLLSRRGRVEKRRLELRERFLTRAHRLTSKHNVVIRWLTVMPLFPASPLTDPATCYTFQRSMPYTSRQRTPDGSFLVVTESTQSLVPGQLQHLRCASAGMFGDVCVADFCKEEFLYRKNAENSGQTAGSRFIEFNDTLQQLVPTMKAGVTFLRSTIGYQGYIHIAMGLSGCTDIQLLRGGRPYSGHPFLDDEYFDEEVVLPNNSITDDEIRPLFDRFQYAFDVEPEQYNLPPS